MGVFYFKCAIIRTKETNINAANSIKKLIIIKFFIQRLALISPKVFKMHKPRSNLMSEANETSSLLLNHIKDEQFYSTLSTITLQLAKETGANKTVIDELSRCFSRVRGSSNQPMLTFEKQNNHSYQNINQTIIGHYDQFEKTISAKEQINFLSKMENELIHSRQKQICINSLNKYATQKQAELLPLTNFSSQTKASRFKSLLGRKQKGKVCTTQNYFKLNTLDLLKNAYENSNECYKMMRNFTLLKTMFGHSMDEDPESNCPLYNVLFDQSENLIISGGQQGAIKIWCKETGLLLSSLKGHQEYINKLEVTKCNKYICSSAGDGVRFFQLQDMTTLTGWKAEAIIEITSVYDQLKGLSKFIFGDKKNIYVLDELKMISAKQRPLTKDDFSIYKYSQRLSKESLIFNIHVSSDRRFVLVGFEYGEIFLFHYNDLFTIDPIKSDTDPLSNMFHLPVRHHLRVHRDEIRELKWHSSNEYFVSGGKEGYCLLWEYKNEKTPTVVKDIQVSKLFNRRKKRAFGCNFICFNCTNTHFVGGFMELVDQDDDDRGNGDIIAYSLQAKEVIFEFSKDMPMKVASIRGMDTHPVYPNVVVVCEGTGRILIIDYLLKTILNSFQLRGFHLLHPHFALNPGDCRFSKDGRYFVVSTEFGSISIFGYDLKNFYQTCPSEQFFANDFTAFSINEKMEPIPIEGDLQIDINRVERGQIRRIRGTPYEHQFTNNFHKYWEQLQHKSEIKPIQHKNSLLKKDQNEEESNDFCKYLQKIKYNAIESETFNKLYHKNLEEIESTRQSLLYDEREKQARVFKKIIQDKARKLKGDSLFIGQSQSFPAIEMTHDSILEQIDAKGKRGGRRLTKMNNEQHPTYKDEFEYNSANEEEYNIDEEAGEQDLNQLDYNVDEESDEIPRTTRRQFVTGRRPEARPRYNIRVRPNGGRTHYREAEESEEEKKEKTYKRRSPAEDVQEMLKDQTFRQYDMNNQGRKRRKRNRMGEQDEDFIQNDNGEEYENEESSDSRVKRREHHSNGHNNSNSRRRGRPRRMVIPQLEEPNSESSQENYGRLRRKVQPIEQSSPEQKQKFSQEQGHHNLRTRNNHISSRNNSSTKKPKNLNLGECYRCVVNQATVVCHYCEIECCDNCKFKRGKELSNEKFECFVCIYVNTTGTAVVEEKKLTEEYFRLNERSHNVYVPQIDDLVRFFFQGYEEFLSHNIKNLNIEPIREIQDYLLMPHIYNDIYGEVLLETPLCKVKEIRYFFPFSPSGDSLSTIYKRRITTNEKKHINMLVNLEIILEGDNKNKTLERNDFWVFFIPGPISIDSDNQYLLRQEIYKYIEENKILQGLKQNQTVQVSGEEYQIVEVGPVEDCFPESVWKQVKISRSDGKRLRHTSKEAERRCNVWEISSLVPKIEYKHDYKPQQFQRKLLDRIKFIRDQIDGYEVYEDYVDFDFISTYRKIIECGICLNSIEQRIKNNHYRSLAGLQFDLDHMVKNSIAFNGEDNEITENGIKIRKELLKAINATEEQLTKFSNTEEEKEEKEEKEPKREKRIVKKKQLGDAFVLDDQMPTSSYGLRNQRSARVRNPESQIPEKGEKRPTLTIKRRPIRIESQDSDFNEHQEQLIKQEASQEAAQQQQKQQKPHQQQHEQESKQQHRRPSRRLSSRPQRYTPPSNTRQQQTSTRPKRHDKIVEDYDKEEEVYKNLQSHSRRNKARYVDSSYDSFQKNSGQGAYQTRRSSRLQN